MKVRNSNSRQVLIKLKNGDVVVIPPYGIMSVEEGIDLPSGVYILESKMIKKDDKGK